MHFLSEMCSDSLKLREFQASLENSRIFKSVEKHTSNGAHTRAADEDLRD